MLPPTPRPPGVTTAPVVVEVNSGIRHVEHASDVGSPATPMPPPAKVADPRGRARRSSVPATEKVVEFVLVEDTLYVAEVPTAAAACHASKARHERQNVAVVALAGVDQVPVAEVYGIAPDAVAEVFTPRPPEAAPEGVLVLWCRRRLGLLRRRRLLATPAPPPTMREPLVEACTGRGGVDGEVAGVHGRDGGGRVHVGELDRPEGATRQTGTALDVAVAAVRSPAIAPQRGQRSHPSPPGHSC